MSDDEVIEQDEAAGMAGTKRINYASQSTEESGKQLELWTLLGETQAVVDATGRKLVRPGKAASFDAKSPARDDGSNRKWQGGSTPPHAKPRLVIAAAKYGNRSVIRRRD